MKPITCYLNSTFFCVQKSSLAKQKEKNLSACIVARLRGSNNLCIRDVKGVTSEEVFTEMGVTKPTFRKYLKGIFSTRTKNKIDSYFAAEKKWLKKLLQSR